MILLFLAVLIYGYYLNYDIRRSTRANLINEVIEDAFTGAVKIFVEGLLVFFRFIELVGRMFCKSK